MKKNSHLIALIWLLSLSPISLFSQGGNPGNVRTPVNFLGFNGTGNFPGPLDIRNGFNDQIRFFTNSTTGIRERMRIFQNGISPSCPTGGGLGINASATAPIAVPGSYLHIGTGITAGGGITPTSIGVLGWRRWMQLGTFMHDASDNMYVGLKFEGTSGVGGGADRYDAIINWGDNQTQANLAPPPGPDFMRFIFTGAYTGSAASTIGSTNGLEILRMSPIGNVGIGNYYDSPLFTSPNKTPARRLEILSDKTAVTVNGNPQFRLTHTQQLSNNY